MTSSREWQAILRLILFVLTLAYIAPAQSVTTTAITQNETPKLSGTEDAKPQSESPVVLIATYQRYSGLRRGREQEMAVVVCTAPSKEAYCPDFSYYSQPSRFAPVAFELNLQPGFTVRYREGNHYRAQRSGTPFESGGKEVVLFKVRAADDVPLGANVLTGRLKLRKGDQGPGGAWSGNGPIEEIEVRIPIVVAGHDDVISQNAVWLGKESIGHQAAQAVQDILAGIPALFICIFDDCR